MMKIEDPPPCYVRMDTDKHLNLGPGRETQIPTQNDRVTPKYVI